MPLKISGIEWIIFHLTCVSELILGIRENHFFHLSKLTVLLLFWGEGGGHEKVMVFLCFKLVLKL